MIQRFYGPWTVEVTSTETAYAQYMVIAGSAASDGTYDAVAGLRLDVEGPEWTLDMLWDDGAGSGHQPSDVRSSSRYEPTGLVVTLGVDDNWDSVRDRDYNDVIVTCSYRDPVSNPAPTAPPFSFTITPEMLRSPETFGPDD